MTIERLMELLDKWKMWMKIDNHKLGYPSKCILLSSGGSATDAFEEMYEVCEDNNVRILDAIISDLEKDQKEAIYYRYIGGKKPLYYEIKLELAIDNLLTISSKKIYA